MATWTELTLWIGLQVCTWLETKPWLVNAIESAFMWMARRSGWWVLVAFILWMYVVRHLIFFQLLESVNPPWPVALLMGFLWAMGSLAIMVWGLVKLIAWALRPRNELRFPTSEGNRNSAPTSSRKSKANRGRLYQSIQERRAQYLAMYRE